MQRACHFLRANRNTAAAVGILLLLFVFFVGAPPVFAQAELAQEVAEAAGLPQTNIVLIIARIIRAFLGVLGIILTVLVIYAGWLYMSAGGETGKVETAKKVLKNAVIGLIIILSAFAITQFVISRLLGAAGLGGATSASIARRYGEPLGSALDGRVISAHYPDRNALDIPRNTKIFITFVESINPASLIDGWSVETPSVTLLNTNNVKIFETAKEEKDALAAEKVKVSVTEEQGPDGKKVYRTFVFDPVDLLGNAQRDTNYTVALKPDIKKERGGDVFTGSSKEGYQWTFEVSTIVDVTPPTIVSFIPSADKTHDRNITVELTFSEAMNPLSAVGTWKQVGTGGAGFTNISVINRRDNKRVPGTYEISNAYRTVSFTTMDNCAKDECNNKIYCLPPLSPIQVEARAATVDAENAPQAELRGGGYDGLTDAAGNSLDGNGDGEATGPAATPGPPPKLSDTKSWSFNTNNNVDKRTPKIKLIAPGILEPLVDPSRPVEITFDMPMKTSSLTNTNVQLWPDPYYAFWFSVTPELIAPTLLSGGVPRITWGLPDQSLTKATIRHPPLVSTEDGGHNYYPVVTSNVKGINQFCLYPSVGPAIVPPGPPGSSCVGAPYCCDGNPSTTACKTGTNKELPIAPQ
ncbi:MAG: hypothetical protein UY77_C0008G0003 [Candidatus Uhrbacteria bacterium GW2011_GWA2_53_10]|uniref:SbsA Ig-like domain-containing protein n=1 Tax=Candidatus Uhrbacteria bacterium GW2011_GWA2_53_10 TaxID=1618980 RepID=A0A0G1XPW9_9BACT|nr:MAG: hypothetical protein UY77_C0008G0003 [Candidatus Uhrbacteria bacterium GW2011_GWA2_53_10]